MVKKIANALELQTEFRRLLAYCESPNPSREKLASEIRTLAAAITDLDLEWELVDTGKKAERLLRNVAHNLGWFLDFAHAHPKDFYWEGQTSDSNATFLLTIGFPEDEEERERKGYDFEIDLTVNGGTRAQHAVNGKILAFERRKKQFSTPKELLDFLGRHLTDQLQDAMEAAKKEWEEEYDG